MEKLTLDISPQDWGSLVTKYAPDGKKVSLADFTDGTVNADTDVTGDITKRKGGPNYNPVALPAAPKDQFEAIFTDGARHLLVVANGEIRYSTGDTVFNTVVNGTGYSTGANFEFATTQDRVYGGNGVNAPIVYDRSTAYGGVVYTAPRIKSMGAQSPATAPTAAVVAGGAVPNGGHTYKVTFLYYDFEESNGSAASNLVTNTAGNQTNNLTAVPIGGYGVTARKIYRDNNDGLWLHVGTIANNTSTTFSDTVAVGVTPTEIPTSNNAPPTFALIEEWLDRHWLGAVPGDPFTLFYTETSMPDIVRPENQVLCNQEDPITAYIVYFGRMVVFNRRSMGQILGTTSDTFRYSAIPSSIGCVDNRSLQTRVINGVPILIWLSDRGFYSYDGNAINYISEEIEDLVNFNIQQATQQKNSNTQSSQTQFQSGTASQGIDLLSLPGSITTKGYNEGTSVPGTNPRRNLDDQGDWEAGTQVANTALRKGDNKLQAISQLSMNNNFPGTRTGDINSATGQVKLNTSTNFTGADTSGTGTSQVSGGFQFAAQRINGVPRAGTITQLRVRVGAGIPTNPANHRYRITAWADGSGSPGSIIFQSGVLQFASVGTTQSVIACSIPLPTSGIIWIGMERIDTVNFTANPISTSDATFTSAAQIFSGGAWTIVGGSSNHFRVGYVFSATPIPASGTYTSNVFDSGSVNANQVFLTTFLSVFSAFGSKTYQIIVEASTDGIGFTQIFTSSLRSSLSGQSISLSGQRYFRIKVTMTATDNRDTDILSLVWLKFPNDVEWISEVIDTTADSTVYNSLVMVSATPQGGSTVTLTIATSTDNISYSPYVAFGSHTVRRYVKLKVTLHMANVDPQQSPTVSSIVFKWTLVANLISSAIDTAVTPPAGWDIFLSSYTLNGNTVSFQMRSATSSGGLTAATFQTVIPGDFPSAVTPLQFVQWKVIITSSDTMVPFVDSVTIQWFISIVASIRPASIFVDSRYYISLALLNQTSNTVLLEFDLNGKWRRHRGLSISTFSYFFNRPYLGLATSGFLRKFLEGLTDNGTAIELDVRFKASDFSTQYQNNSSKVKVVGEVILQGTNTGATLNMFYSVDNGVTFYPMYTPDGLTNYVTLTDGTNFYVRFRPVWDGSVPISGRTIMYRVYSNDVNAVEIVSLEASAFLRRQVPVITG